MSEPTSSAWADPSTQTTEGVPYSGPPPTAPPQPGGPYGFAPTGYGPPGYAPPGYSPPYGYPLPGCAPPYGYPVPYGYGPPGYPPVGGPPARPGSVIAAAVIAFVQAALVAFASLYAFLLAGLVSFAAGQGAGGGVAADGLAAEATVLAVVQLVSVIALVVGGLLALTHRPERPGGRRAWLVLVIALGAQLVLAAYWAIRFTVLLGDIPGPGDGASGVLVAMSVAFAAGPAVAVGLSLSRSSRTWFGTDRSVAR